MPGEQCFGEVWDMLKGNKCSGPFKLQCISFPRLFVAVNSASYGKNVHSVYETCLFLLDIRKYLENPIWSVYATYSLMPCFHAFPWIACSVCQAAVFKLVCPDPLIFSICLLAFISMFSWLCFPEFKQLSLSHCFLGFMHA